MSNNKFFYDNNKSYAECNCDACQSEYAGSRQNCQEIMAQSDAANCEAAKHLEAAVDALKDSLCELKKYSKCKCVADELENIAEQCLETNAKIDKCFGRNNCLAAAKKHRRPSKCDVLWIKSEKAEAQAEALADQAKDILCKGLECLKQAQKCNEEACRLANEAKECEICNLCNDDDF